MFHRWSNSHQQDQGSSELYTESKVCFFLFDDINVLFRKSLGDLGLETYEGSQNRFHVSKNV